MPFCNWLGGAEVSHATSESYKKKVIELLELDGFVLTQSSSDVAMTPDLIFRKADAEGKTDVYVETKYDDVSLSDKEFLSELARYFLIYSSKSVEPFDLYLFFRRCKNVVKWRQVFSASSLNEEMCLALLRMLSENEELSQENRQAIREADFEEFRKFVCDTYVHQLDYERLLMKIEERKKGKENRIIGYDYYLRELPPIEEKQKIIGNFVEVKKYRGSIFSWQIQDDVNYKVIYALIKRYEPFCLKGDRLYSLDRNNERLTGCIKEETLRVLNPQEWILELPGRIAILQTLYKKCILNYGVVKGGCNYVHDENSGTDILYLPHKDYTKPLTKVKGKQVSRLFKDTSSPFAKHEAIEINVKIYDWRLFVFFSPVVLFTDNKKQLITGDNVRRLHDLFSPNRYDTNLSIFGDTKWWFEYLCGKGKTALETSELSSFTGFLKPPKDTKMRNALAATERIEKWFVQN